MAVSPRSLQKGLILSAGFFLLMGCAPKKPSAYMAIPQECIDKLLIEKPNAQCNDLPNGNFKCKDFVVVAHCTKVHQQ